MELTKPQETYRTCAILKGNLLKGSGHLSIIEW
jgi:hypothetical protein